MLLSAATIYLSLFLFMLGRAYRAHHLEDYIPSLAWCLLSVLPFLAIKSEFIQDYVPAQAIGVFSFAFALLLADSLRPRPLISDKNQPPDGFLNLLTLSTIGVALLIQLAHIALMPKIPLLEVLRGGGQTLAEQWELREMSSKLLKVPPGTTYLFQISWCVLAPIGIILLVYLGRFKMAATAFLLTAIYSRLTLARGPIYILLALLMIGLIGFINKRWFKRTIVAVTILVSVLAIPLGYFYTTSPISIFNYRSRDPDLYSHASIFQNQSDRVPSFTVNDHYRELLGQEVYQQAPKWQVSANYFLYRIFLDPIEVSHRWYHYFPKIHGGYLGSYGLTLKSRSHGTFQHPATALGLWAYRSRFPNFYGETLRAYSGADADAYSRWGITGIFVLAILTGLVRLSLSYFRLPGKWGAGINRATLVLFALSLPIASLQATLIAQGVVFYLFFMVIFALYTKVPELRLLHHNSIKD